MLRKLGIALTLGALTGCGTLAATKVEYGPRIYGGVRYDVDDLAIEGFPLGTLCGLLDFPFSFVADTVMLPYTIVVALSDEPASVTIIEGYVVQADKPDNPTLEVAISGPLPPHLKPIAGIDVKVGALSAKTDARGYFSLRRQTGDEWESIRVVGPAWRLVDIPVSELRRLDSQKYWRDHSLRIRLQRR